MKRLFILLLALLFILPLSAQEILTRDDFLPPPPSEKELLGDWVLDEKGLRNGMYLAGTGIAACSVLTYAALQGVAANGMSEPYGTDLQAGIVLTGAGFVGTAFFAILFDSLRDSRKESGPTSEE